MAPIGQSGNTGSDGIASLLRARAAALGHSPYIVFYDDVTGERTELSYATFFNWSSKAANLLAEEFDLGPGGTLALGVDRHWTGAVLATAAWTVGAAVAFSTAAEADVLVVTEDAAATVADRPGLLVVGAGMGGRLTGDAPGLSFGDEVLAFGDDYADPDVGNENLAIAEPALSQGDLRAAAVDVLSEGDRLLATAPLRPDTVAAVLVAPALAGASVVWCPVQAPADLSSRSTAERATHVLDGSTVTQLSH